MKLRLLAEWWKDNRLHSMDLVGPVTLSEIDLMMKFGSEWRDSLTIGPLDVSEIESLKLIIQRED